MPNQESAALQDRLKLIVRIDGTRPAGDPFKLPPFLLADAIADLATLVDTDEDTAPAEGDRSAASGRRRRALQELERQLRGGHRFLVGIDESEMTEEERTKALEAYGWKGGKIGGVLGEDDLVLANARLALGIDVEKVPNPAHRYPAARLERIETQLEIAELDQDTATGGPRQGATRLRDAALETAATTASRVRFYYCAASRDADQTTELARIGFQPRRNPQAAAAVDPTAAVVQTEPLK